MTADRRLNYPTGNTPGLTNRGEPCDSAIPGSGEGSEGGRNPGRVDMTTLAVCPGCQCEFDPMTEYRTSRGAIGRRKRRWCSNECRSRFYGAKDKAKNKRKPRSLPDDANAHERRQYAATTKRNENYDSGGRHLIDPCTCERVYTDDERIFMMAVERYKRVAQRPYPTLSEILEVLVSLGYRRVAEPTALPTATH